MNIFYPNFFMTCKHLLMSHNQKTIYMRHYWRTGGVVKSILGLAKLINQNFISSKLTLARSSRPEVFCKKDIRRNFAKFTGKHLCQDFFFNKVAGACNFIKKEALGQLFPVNFPKFLRTHFFTKHPL